MTGTGPRVVLVGPPGAGKSTVAALLAARWGVPVRETDEDVAQAAGKPVADVFVEDGEPRFRELEHEAARAALAADGVVLALGGGAVLHPATGGALRAYRAGGGVVVLLEVSLRHAAPRVGFNQARPLLLGNPRARWQQLLDERRPVYEQVASWSVATDGRTPEQVADEVAARVEGAAAEGGPGAGTDAGHDEVDGGAGA